MSGPGFGFSVGDFIAGIKLAKDLVHALNDGIGAKPAYQRLAADLRNLLCALAELHHISVDNLPATQRIALEEAILRCQATIKCFLEKNAKFRLSLGEERTTSRFRASLHKMQWALCKQDEIDQLRTQLLGHTSTINTLLITMQSSAAALQAELMQNYQKDTQAQSIILTETKQRVEKIHDMLHAQADAISKTSEVLGPSVSQMKSGDLQSLMVKALDANMRICQLATAMQKPQPYFDIPSQIDRQQPVHLEDAHGRVAPFHIEFINSFEAFQAVMEVRFRHVPGLRKVQHMEYSIREPASNRQLDLHAPWESVFLPGRKVTMSMIFWEPSTSMSSCPVCQYEDIMAAKLEIQCPNPGCRIWYERIVESWDAMETPCPSALQVQKSLISDPDVIGSDMDSNDASEDKICQFRRVQVRHVLNIPK